MKRKQQMVSHHFSEMPHVECNEAVNMTIQAVYMWKHKQKVVASDVDSQPQPELAACNSIAMRSTFGIWLCVCIVNRIICTSFVL